LRTRLGQLVGQYRLGTPDDDETKGRGECQTYANAFTPVSWIILQSDSLTLTTKDLRKLTEIGKFGVRHALLRVA